MERQQSIARQNRFFWETIFAFTFTLIAAILEVFHFVNNAWLVQGGPTLQYQRGLGSDCVKSERFQNGGGIRCSPWGDQTSTFVINGKRIQPDNVTEPILALRVARILMFISILLYVIVILTILIVCSKRDLQLKCFKTKVKILRILCIATLLLMLINLNIAFLVFYSSFYPFITNKGYCSLGSAYGYFLVSNLMLLLGAMSHFDLWFDEWHHLKHFITTKLATAISATTQVHVQESELNNVDRYHL